ncbi:unnamed protein product [Effrenium voratum]|nr:unnamed protein product [Effrenium voratum]
MLLPVGRPCAEAFARPLGPLLRASAPSRTAPARARQAPWARLQAAPCARLLCLLVLWSAALGLGRSFLFTSSLVSRLMLGVFGLIFASLARQADGLMGVHGISPLRTKFFGRPGRLAKICSLVALAGACLPCGRWGGGFAAVALLALSQVYRVFLKAEFLRFQWDTLAVEAGFWAALAALPPVFGAASASARICGALCMHSLQQLGFKLMWGSCLCKLMSGCPEWSSGRAMQHHHRTTCLPKPMARRLHLLSVRSLRISAIQGLMTLWVEGPLSLLALLGWPFGRAVCAVLWCGLMLGIAVSGNYGFFNILTCVIALALLDDTQLGQATATPLWQFGMMDVPLLTLTAGAWLLYTAATWAALFEICGAQAPSWCASAERWLKHRRLANRYGLFARMTTTRDEVVIRELHELPEELGEQAARDGLVRKEGKKFWVELALPYKPGPLNRKPPSLWTHMPRLDWQLWFVSLAWARGQKPAWFRRFLKLLRDRQPEVVALVEHKAQHPVQSYVLKRAPERVRVTLEDYEYSDNSESGEWECGRWWCRRSSPNMPREAPLPSVSSEDIEVEAPEPMPTAKHGSHLWQRLTRSLGLLQTNVGVVRRSALDPAILVAGLLTLVIAMTVVIAFCTHPPDTAGDGKRPVTRCPAPRDSTAAAVLSAAEATSRLRARPSVKGGNARTFPAPAAGVPYSAVSVPAASATSLPSPRRPSHVGGEEGGMFSWSPRSEEEDTLCPCLVVPPGMEFVFAVREVLCGSRQELSFSIVDLEGSPLSHVIVNESGSGPQCGLFLQMLDREPLASVRTDVLYAWPSGLPQICLPSGEVYCTVEKGWGRQYLLRDVNNQKLLKLEGNFKEKMVKIISMSGQLVALSERCTVNFDGGTYYQVRVAPHTDAGLILCSLLAIDKIEGKA